MPQDQTFPFLWLPGRNLLTRILWLFIPLLLADKTLAVPRPADFARPASLFVAPLPTMSLPVTTEFTENVPALQTTTTNEPAATEGVINTELSAPGNPTKQPFPSPADASPTTSIDTLAVPTASLTTTVLEPTTGTKANILSVPIATAPPPSLFQTRNDHPRSPVNISGRSGPLHTNKFYGNFLVGDQREPSWPQPYSLWWAKDGNVLPRHGVENSWGLAISNIDRDQLQFGDPQQAGDPPKYFIAPLYVQEMIMSAVELGAGTLLTTDSHKQFSVNVNLQPTAATAPVIRFPIVQGMGFVSGLYTAATPLLQSNVLFTGLIEAGEVNNGATYKWRIDLKDGSRWLLYMTPNGATGRPPMVLRNSNSIVGPPGFTGLVQVAKNKADVCGELIHDQSAGAYPVSRSVSASVEGSTGTYSFTWQRGGSDKQKLLMYALPHHIRSMVSDSLAMGTCVLLWTGTKGLARGFQGDIWTLQEKDLPVNIDFDPWRPDVGTIRRVAASAIDHISDAAAKELAFDLDVLSKEQSAYYAGKAFSKYALIIYTANKLGHNPGLAAIGLQKLEQALARWINNQQTWPLAYDPVWGGLVSTASYEGREPLMDFGNTLYNDHHFHYGYFVHAAAIIAYLHPEWLKQGQNKIWVDTLIRDYANSDANDPYFPPSRAFDFFNGHSWATGVFPSGDGKNEESTSEDAFSAYAMKLWGHVTGDPNMEARGNLQLAIMKNSFSSYFYYDKDSNVQPAAFAANVVSGILFENKIDHATFFGGESEFVHGIHMLPISPITSYMRPSSFVAHEWATYFQSTIPLYASPDPITGMISAVSAYGGGYNCSAKKNTGRLINCVKPEWKGLLMGNLAQIDPSLSWQYFADEGGINGPQGFDWNSLSGSGSRTWYLAYAAAFGGIRG